LVIESTSVLVIKIVYGNSMASANADLMFKAFSDRIRLRLLHLLLHGEMCVCDLVDIIKVPQPTASRHLAYLRKSGLVQTRKKGLWTYYSLTPAKTAFHKNLLNCLKACFDEVSEIQKDEKYRARLKADKCC
jgi:ArsR family transcriptional regulator